MALDKCIVDRILYSHRIGKCQNTEGCKYNVTCPACDTGLVNYTFQRSDRSIARGRCDDCGARWLEQLDDAGYILRIVERK